MSRHAAALLWLALALGTPMRAESADPVLAPEVEEIRKRVRAGELDAAIKAGEAVVESRADDGQAWFWLARAYGQQAIQASLLGKAKWASRAHDAYLRAVQLDGDNLDARFDLMQFYLQAPGFMGGDRDKAMQQASEIGQRNPVLGKLAEGAIALSDDDARAAEATYRAALALDPAHERARITLAMHLQREERWDEVVAVWRESLTRNADDALAHYQLGRYAALTGHELDAGLVHLDRFLALGQTPEGMTVGAAHWRRGQILEKLGRRDEAVAALVSAVTAEPNLEPAHADLKRLRAP